MNILHKLALKLKLSLQKKAGDWQPQYDEYSSGSNLAGGGIGSTQDPYINPLHKSILEREQPSENAQSGAAGGEFSRDPGAGDDDPWGESNMMRPLKRTPLPSEDRENPDFNGGKDTEYMQRQFGLNLNPTKKYAKANPYDASTIQIAIIPEELKNQIRKLQKGIPKDILDTHEDARGWVKNGLQALLHITVLFGVDDDINDQVRKIFGKYPSIEISADKLDYFDNDDITVAVIRCSSDSLRELHNELKKNIANEDTHPTYKPHITVAYLKKGERIQGEFKPVSWTIEKIEISKSTGKRDKISSTLSLKKRAREYVHPQYGEQLQEELVKNVYELEYKYSQTQNPQYKNFYLAELDQALNQALPVVEKLITTWHNYHANNPEWTAWAQEPAVMQIGKLLSEFSNLRAGSTNEKLILFHKALNSVHITGPMADHLIGTDPELGIRGREILDELSSDKFIPQYEQDLRKEVEGSKLNLRKKAEGEEVVPRLESVPEYQVTDPSVHVCSYCNRLMDAQSNPVLDSMDPQQLAQLMQEKSVSHGICTECYQKQLAQLQEMRKNKQVVSMRVRSNILDSTRSELDPKIWEEGKDSLPLLRPNIKVDLIKKFMDYIRLYGGYKNPEHWIKNMFYTGSTATYKFKDSSDVDIHVLIDWADMLKANPDKEKPTLNQMWQELHDTFWWTLNKERLPGTKHPLQYYVVRPGEEQKVLQQKEEIYDMGHDVWLIAPGQQAVELTPQTLRPAIEEAKRIIRRIDRYLMDAKEMAIDYDIIKEMLNEGNQGEVLELLNGKLKRLDDDLVVVKDEYRRLKKMRQDAFEQGTPLVQDANQNYTMGNIVYKLVERYKIMDVLRAIQHTTDSKPVTHDQMGDVNEILGIETGDKESI